MGAQQPASVALRNQSNRHVKLFRSYFNAVLSLYGIQIDDAITYKNEINHI